MTSQKLQLRLGEDFDLDLLDEGKLLTEHEDLDLFGWLEKIEGTVNDEADRGWLAKVRLLLHTLFIRNCVHASNEVGSTLSAIRGACANMHVSSAPSKAG